MSSETRRYVPPKKFSAFAVFEDETGECSCNETSPYPAEYSICRGFSDVPVIVIAKSEYDDTEAKVRGVVEALEDIAESWGPTANSKGEDDYSFGRRQVAESVIEELREALSKFRGGVSINAKDTKS